MSGGLSKLLKNDNGPGKSRINKVNANYSMYDKMASSSTGFSPDKEGMEKPIEENMR